VGEDGEDSATTDLLAGGENFVMRGLSRSEMLTVEEECEGGGVWSMVM